MDNSVTQVTIILRFVVCMVVRCEQVNVEPLEINLTDPQTLASKPVSVKYLVRVAIETELVECCIFDPDFAEYCCSTANHSVIKIVTAGQDRGRQVLDSQIVVSGP